MVADIIRDSVFGHAVRLATGNKYFQYPEERDPEYWKRYINDEKSAELATLGKTRTQLAREQAEKGSEDTPKAEKEEENDLTAAPNDSSSTLTEDNNNQIKRVDPEKGVDTAIVDWWGPEDPENPQNWSRAKKFFVTFEICFLTFSVYIGSAIYSAGIESVMVTFGVSQVASTLGLTLFVIGYALGPMIWAPMSEIPQIGRNPVYIGTLILFVVLQVPTALAVNFGMLMAFRFLTGFIGSPSLATGGASIGDMYTPAKRTYGIAVWGIGAVSGPTLGPVVGGWAAEFKGWKWPIWELMWLSGGCLAMLIFFLPETSSTNILYRRARRLRKLTGNDKITCEAEIESKDMTGKEIAMMTLVRPFTLSITEPIALALNVYIALIYGKITHPREFDPLIGAGLLYIWFESFPIVFIEIYGFSLGTEGLAFLGILVGVLIVFPPFIWYQYKYVEPKFDENGDLKPEFRLPPSFVGAFCIPICLFWFGMFNSHLRSHQR